MRCHRRAHHGFKQCSTWPCASNLQQSRSISLRKVGFQSSPSAQYTTSDAFCAWKTRLSRSFTSKYIKFLSTKVVARDLSHGGDLDDRPLRPFNAEIKRLSNFWIPPICGRRKSPNQRRCYAQAFRPRLIVLKSRHLNY